MDDATYLLLAYLHLGTVFPAFVIGTYLMLNRKGSQHHKLLGKIYMILMLITALISLSMSARVSYTIFNHFGFIHLFSVLVLYSVPSAYIAIKKGNIKKHRVNMISLYVGGLLIAGSFTLMPGRLLHGWVFG